MDNDFRTFDFRYNYFQQSHCNLFQVKKRADNEFWIIFSVVSHKNIKLRKNAFSPCFSLNLIGQCQTEPSYGAKKLNQPMFFVVMSSYFAFGFFRNWNRSI